MANCSVNELLSTRVVLLYESPKSSAYGGARTETKITVNIFEQKFNGSIYGINILNYVRPYMLSYKNIVSVQPYMVVQK